MEVSRGQPLLSISVKSHADVGPKTVQKFTAALPELEVLFNCLHLSCWHMDYQKDLFQL